VSDITGFLALTKTQRAEVETSVAAASCGGSSEGNSVVRKNTVGIVVAKDEAKPEGDGGEGASKRARAASTSGGGGVKTEEGTTGEEEGKATSTPARRASRRGAAPDTDAIPLVKVTAAAARAAAKSTATAAADPPGDGLTEFEREREERIARNKERMVALNIGQLAAEVSSHGAAGKREGPIQRGIGAKRQRPPKEEPGPVRRSLRAAKIAPDAALAGGVDYERRDGTVILTNGMTADGGSGGGDVDKGPSRPTGDIPLDSANGSEGADEAFVRFLRHSMCAPIAAAALFTPGGFLTSTLFAASLSGASSTSCASLVSARMALRDESVAKVTPRGVTHLDFAPYDPAGPLVAAAGDKDGNVGLWRVDQLSAESSAAEAGDGSEDGVLFYRPHGSYISHLKWGRGGLAGRLITCAYDGVVRALDAEKGMFTEIFASTDGDEFSGCDVTADGRTAYLVDNGGNLHVVDVRAGKLTAPAVELHGKKINTVHLEPGSERLIATSCGDQTVCVWDVRNTGGV
jgi:hypothetical protein